MQLAPRYCNPGEEGFNGDGVLAPIFQSGEHGEIQTSGEPGVERAIFQSLTNGMRTAVRKGNSGLCCCSCCWLWFTRRGSRSSSPAGNVLLRLGVASHWSNGGVDPGSALQLHASAWGFSFSGLTLPAPARRDDTTTKIPRRRAKRTGVRFGARRPAGGPAAAKPLHPFSFHERSRSKPRLIDRDQGEAVR